MDRELAKHVALLSLRALSPLTDLLPTLKQHCAAEEYQELLRSIADASAHTYLEITKKIYSRYPDLEQEIEDNINKYGIFM